MKLKITQQFPMFLLSIFAAVVGSVYLTHQYLVVRDVLPGVVIVLNGPSAVGKSAIQKAFAASQNSLWLSLGIDSLFVGVLPPKVYLEPSVEHAQVMRGIAGHDAHGNKIFKLEVGAVGQSVVKGMHLAIAAYARAGNNVIVDYIAYDQAWREDLLKALAGIRVFCVGVTASLATIEAREKLRATSPQGHARSIYDSVHAGWKYDLTVNTDNLSASQAADQIVAVLEKRKGHEWSFFVPHGDPKCLSKALISRLRCALGVQ